MRDQAWGIQGYEAKKTYVQKDLAQIYKEFDPKDLKKKPPKIKQGKYDVNAKRGNFNDLLLSEKKNVPAPGHCKLLSPSF